MKAENRLNYFQLLTWARQLLRYLTAEATSRVFGNRLRLGSSENLVIHSLWILLDHGHGISNKPNMVKHLPCKQETKTHEPTHLLTIPKYKMHFGRRGTSHSIEKI